MTKTPLGIMRAAARKQQREILALERKVRELTKDNDRLYGLLAEPPELKRKVRELNACLKIYDTVLWQIATGGPSTNRKRIARAAIAFIRTQRDARIAAAKKKAKG